MKQAKPNTLANISLRKIQINYMILILLFSSEFYTWTEAMPVNTSCPANLYLNSNNECVLCSICSDWQHIKSTCSENSDTVCDICPSRKFKSKTKNTCRRCKVCHAGQYIRNECTNTTDTVCVACPSGTFSMADNADRCRPCKHCKFSEILLTRCNTSNDSKCGDCTAEYYRDVASGDCERCSYCDPKVDFITVPECEHKLGSSSEYVCVPFGRPYPDTTEPQMTTMVYVTTMAIGTDTNWSVIVTVVSFILVIVGFLVCVQKQYSKQGFYEDENHALVSFVEHNEHSHTNNCTTDNPSNVVQEPKSTIVETQSKDVCQLKSVHQKPCFNKISTIGRSVIEKPFVTVESGIEQTEVDLSSLDSGIVVEEIKSNLNCDGVNKNSQKQKNDMPPKRKQTSKSISSCNGQLWKSSRYYLPSHFI